MKEIKLRYRIMCAVSALWWVFIGSSVGLVMANVVRWRVYPLLCSAVSLVLLLLAYFYTIASYRDFLKNAMADPTKQIDYMGITVSKASRLKLSFDSWVTMYIANQDPWTLDDDNPPIHKREEIDPSQFGCVQRNVYRTIVFFGFNDYFRYKHWLKARLRQKKLAAVKKLEAEFTENELKLNLQFLDTVSEDVKKMKESAEAEIQKAADELKKAAQPK